MAVAAGLLASCNFAAPEPPLQSLTGEWRVITISNAAFLLEQCDRSTGRRGQSFFEPSIAEIAAMERALTARLNREGYFQSVRGQIIREAELKGIMVEPPFMPATTLEGQWNREYIGVIRAGVRHIYGRYSPRTRVTGLSSDIIPTVTCGGGPRYFGAEFNPANEAITDLEFNGA